MFSLFATYPGAFMVLKHSLIVIAGWGYPAAALEELGHALAPDVRVVPVSARELWLKGRVEHEAGPLSRYAAGLGAFIREQGNVAAVAGWSLGGMAALELAARHPETIGRLALISSTPKFCTDAEFTCGVPSANVRAMRRGLKRDPGTVLADFYRLAASPFEESPAGIPDQVSAECEELTAGLDYLLRMDLRHWLNSIRIPVLLAHGREDRVIPWQAAEYAHRGVSGSRLCLYDGIGHDLPLREPEKLADAIQEFLSA